MVGSCGIKEPKKRKLGELFLVETGFLVRIPTVQLGGCSSVG